MSNAFGQHPGYPPNPYGSPSPGQDWFAPATPRPYPAPLGMQPPGQPKLNLFAVLSVAFAFLAPPAGAVLGHLGLRRIKRTGERGRTLAIIGTALSYPMTVLVIVGLVLWLVHGHASTTDTARKPVGPSSTAAPDSALLGADQLTSLFSQPFDHQYPTRTTGGQHGLQDFSTTDPSHATCAGAVFPRARTTYRDHSVAGYAYQLWREPLPPLGKVIMVEEAVVAMDSAASAQQVLERATTEWKACDGTNVNFRASSANVDYTPEPVKDVRVTDSILTATVGHVRSARALAVKDNVVVEAVVALQNDLSTPYLVGTATVESSGVDVVKAIMDRLS